MRLCRIERRLDLFERPIQLRAKQPFVQIACAESIAVLAAHGAVEFHDQLAHFLRDSFEADRCRPAGQVEHRTNVQAAHRGMTVERALGAVPRHDLAKAVDELRARGRANGAILDEGHRLARAGHAQQQRQRRLAARPDVVAHRFLERRQNMEQTRLDLASLRRDVPSALASTSSRGFAAEFDQHQRLGLAHHEIEIVAILQAPFRQSHDQPVEQLGG